MLNKMLVEDYPVEDTLPLAEVSILCIKKIILRDQALTGCRESQPTTRQLTLIHLPFEGEQKVSPHGFVNLRAGFLSVLPP